MNILFADTAHPKLKSSLEALGHQCDYFEDLNRPLALERIHAYDGVVIRSRFRFDKEMIDEAKKLKFIARVGAGMENIDVDYAQAKGIACLHAPEGNRNAVAEQALGMLLAMMNHLVRADREVREGKWIREGNRGNELYGLCVGIIGLGNTGSTFAKRLSGFDVQILGYDPHLSSHENKSIHLVDMTEIFEQADVISLHVPLNEETHGLVNQDWLNQFKKSIWFLNTSRGKCVNTADLLDAIDSGRVKAAGLDVLEFESLSFEHMDAGNPTIERLRTHPKVLLSPHIAGWTHESNVKMAEVLVEKIQVISS